MNTRKYHGVEAVTLQSGSCEAVVLPGRGCKLASLRHGAFEYLVQPEEEGLPPVRYGESYARGGLFGMDDMFPTINESFYPCGPWRGTPLPDHGECWTQPFEAREEGGVLRAVMRGVRLPYRLHKAIWFSGPCVLHTEYRLENLSQYAMPFIWAAHPLCRVMADSMVEMPEGTASVVNTLDSSNRLGKTGTLHTWPVTMDKYGSPMDLRACGETDGTCEKFFTDRRFETGGITLRHPGAGERLRLRFPAERVPYAGVWLNKGGYLGLHHVGLEPAAGSMDDLYLAYQLEECAVLPGNGEYRFYLDFEVGGEER